MAIDIMIMTSMTTTPMIMVMTTMLSLLLLNAVKAGFAAASALPAAVRRGAMAPALHSAYTHACACCGTRPCQRLALPAPRYSALQLQCRMTVVALQWHWWSSRSTGVLD